MPEESVLMVALTLARIFPYLEYTDPVDDNWLWTHSTSPGKLSITQVINTPSLQFEATLVTSPQEPPSRTVVN